MEKRISKKKQKYISRYTNEAYITYQFRLRKTKDRRFIKEVSSYIGKDDRQVIKKILFEFLVKKHIHFETEYIYGYFIKLLFLELEINKQVKLSSFNQIIQLYNYGFIDLAGLELVLEQFDAELVSKKHYGQYNKYFIFDELSKDCDYIDETKCFDDKLNELIKSKEKIHFYEVNNIVPIVDSFKIEKR